MAGNFKRDLLTRWMEACEPIWITDCFNMSYYGQVVAVGDDAIEFLTTYGRFGSQEYHRIGMDLGSITGWSTQPPSRYNLKNMLDGIFKGVDGEGVGLKKIEEIAPAPEFASELYNNSEDNPS